MFGYNDAYRRLHSFLKQWRAAQAGSSRTSPSCGADVCPEEVHTCSGGPASPITQQTQKRVSHTLAEMATTGPIPAAETSSPAQQEVKRGTAKASRPAEHGHHRAGVLITPYIVSVDVSRAFDNVDAEVLLGIVEPLLRCPEYLIVKYSEVTFLHACAIIRGLVIHLYRHAGSHPLR